MSTAQAELLFAAASLAGLVRGFTGGAGANIVLAPALSLVLGPRHAVPLVLLLGVVTSVQLVPGALKQVRWREILPLGLSAWAGIPLGMVALLSINQESMRRGMAALALAFTVLLMTGWRYRGRRGLPVSIGVGAGVGFLNSAVSIAGPPLFLYLLSGTDGSAVQRASFIVVSAMMQTVALFAFALTGAFDRAMLVAFMLMLVPFAVSIQIGAALFRKADELMFRRIAMGVMAIVSLAALLH
jgi:uncharacterized membrane protein YfcA